MFGRRFRHRGRLRAILTLAAIVVAVLPVATPVHAFGLSGAQVVEGIEKAGDVLNAAEEAERHRKSATEQFVAERSGKVVGEAAGAIERGAIRVTGNAWDTLVKSDSKIGDLAKKAARRWGPAVRRGLRLAGPVGRVVDTADAGLTIGTGIARFGFIPLMDRVYDSRSRELEEKIRRDAKKIRKRAEFRRTLDEDIAAYQRASRAMAEEERRLYGSDGARPANNSLSDTKRSEELNPWESVASAEPDPWEKEGTTREREVWGMGREARRRQAPEGSGSASGSWSTYEGGESRNPWAQGTSNASGPWQRDGTLRNQEGSGWDEWSRETVEADRSIEEEREGPTYTAMVANALREAPYQEASEGDYRSALAALEHREAEDLRAAEAERRRAEQEAERLAEQEAERLAEQEAERRRAEQEAERERQQAARRSELSQEQAAREAQRIQAEALAARRVERESWMQLGTTITQGVAAIAAARQGYTGSSGLPSIPSSSSSATNSWLPRMRRPSSLPPLSNSTSLPSAGSGAGNEPISSNCKEDLTPMCRQVLSTIATRAAAIQARLNSGGLSMSQTLDLAAEEYKIFLDHAPACFATETRPHCRAENQRRLEEVRKAYQSSLDAARQARGG